MKKIVIFLIFLSIIIPLFAVVDGSQWIYTGTSPAGTAKAYTGVSLQQYAGDFLYNPAVPALINRFTFFGNTGFLSKDLIVNAGLTIPMPNGIMTFAGKMLNSTRAVGSISGFDIGFAKSITESFSFGFKGSFLNQTIRTTNNGNEVLSSDIAVTLDAGAIFTLRNLVPFDRGFGIRNNTIGLVILGLGKPSVLQNNSSIPGMGLKGGVSFEWMDFENVKALSSIELTSYFFPLCYSSAAGLTLNLFNIFNLRGGLIYGSNGLGSASDGLLFYTLGASLAYQFGETPVEIFYSYNPHQFQGVPEATHFIGMEIGFGSIDKNPPTIEISFDGVKTNLAYFSPNYDGAQDVVSIDLDIRDESLIADWDISIYNSKGERVRHREGEKERDVSLDFDLFWKKLWANKESVPVPKKIVWNGTSDSGAILPEGTYYFIVTARDELNNLAVSKTNTIILDVTPPSGSLSLYDSVFSPNGDGKKDIIIISQTLSSNDFWRAEIRDVNGKKVREWNWGLNPPMQLEWDGRNDAGVLQPEGTYDYIAYGWDRAGNKAVLPMPGINLSLKKYSVFLALDRNGISPNGDSVNDTLRLVPSVSDSNGLVSWALRIKDKNHAVIREIKGKNLPSFIQWDGKDAGNTTVRDGHYLCSLLCEYANGETPVSQEYPVTVDTTPPSVEFSAEPALFSPDNDGENDTLFIHFNAQDEEGIKKWRITILDPDNKPFKIFEGSANPADTIQWDGRSENGELVESAQDYRVRVYAEDSLGNITEKEIDKPISVDVLVEKTDRGLKIRINNIEFDFAKASLKPKKAFILDRVAQILQKYGGYKVEIQGHTDNIGSEEKNLKLSRERAQTVYDYLVKKGISGTRLTTAGFGFQFPVANNSSEEGRRKNRRVEFILLKN